ncbi:MAG: bifunctional phosphoribosyl-AMP cyclohydrolase/phosphoribosyl-ATP diphosphatase HisIE [Lachnospiraceae bacterium]|nr:bifunctional phosphoribosyl-AMP cyclohydrolase/phosphoribosyl-ATP diphosphatase HisIE [Lachnospiraceae bacterium]
MNEVLPLDEKKIIPYLNAENELEESVIAKSRAYEEAGADELFLYNFSAVEKEQEAFLKTIKAVCREVEIPVLIGCHVNRFEDVKKAFYTGAARVVISWAKLKNREVIKEASARFGMDKILILLDASGENEVGGPSALEPFAPIEPGTDSNAGVQAVSADRATVAAFLKESGAAGVILKHVTLTDKVKKLIAECGLPVIIRDSLQRNDMEELLSINDVVGVATNYYENKDIRRIKRTLKEAGFAVNTFESSLEFSEFKLNSDGLIPVIVQDYKTSEVLMMAYMNEEAFRNTVESGRMTYFSRSRQKLWLKGETSGHFQFVKELKIDCDNDTLLAKVKQIGAACHTGSRSCFYTDLINKEYDTVNPLTVLEEVYGVIMDRKEHPKEGSYTNYLFDKGIDKILKKCGEEATEIVIAAKNPDSEELKYEISDFLYHMMVLMAQCGLNWDDIVKELAHRR